MIVLTGQLEVACNVLGSHTGHNDERALGRLIESIQRRYVIVAVERFLVPFTLSGVDLQFTLQDALMKLRRLELGNLLGLGLMSLRAKVLRVRHAIRRERRQLLGLTSERLARDNLSRRLRGGTEALRHDQADRHVPNLLTTLLFQDDFEVRRSRDVQEVLRVAAPELILLAVVDESATGRIRHGLPRALELLLDGVGQLHEVNRV